MKNKKKRVETREIELAWGRTDFNVTEELTTKFQTFEFQSFRMNLGIHERDMKKTNYF